MTARIGFRFDGVYWRAVSVYHHEASKSWHGGWKQCGTATALTQIMARGLETMWNRHSAYDAVAGTSVDDAWKQVVSIVRGGNVYLMTLISVDP
jgi:hypothetical protein